MSQSPSAPRSPLKGMWASFVHSQAGCRGVAAKYGVLIRQYEGCSGQYRDGRLGQLREADFSDLSVWPVFMRLSSTLTMKVLSTQWLQSLQSASSASD